MKENVRKAQIEDKFRALLSMKISEKRGLTPKELAGYRFRSCVHKILEMSNDEIMIEAGKIMNKTSGLSIKEREFCIYVANQIELADMPLRLGKIQPSNNSGKNADISAPQDSE